MVLELGGKSIDTVKLNSQCKEGAGDVNVH